MEVKENTVVTENVVNLVAAKLSELPAHVRAPLPLLASIGPVFRVDMFELMLSKLGPAMRDCVEPAESQTREGAVETSDADCDTPRDILTAWEVEGLIEPNGCASYHWVHDKVQETALKLLSKSKLEDLKFQFGLILLEQAGDFETNGIESLGRDIFTIVNLLRNGSASLDENDPTRLKIAKLCLVAGTRAIEVDQTRRGADHVDDERRSLRPLPELTA